MAFPLLLFDYFRNIVQSVRGFYLYKTNSGQRMSPNGYYVPYEKTLLQSMLYDGGGHVNEQTNEVNERWKFVFPKMV